MWRGGAKDLPALDVRRGGPRIPGHHRHTALAAQMLRARIKRPGRTALVTRFGGIPLKQQERAVLSDRLPYLVIIRRKEVLSGSSAANVRPAGRSGRWKSTTSASSPTSPGQANRSGGVGHGERRRKTLAAYAACHATIHARQSAATPTE